MGQAIELIVGLGNPGAEYALTRHNVGFWFVDALAEQAGTGFRSDRKLEGDIADAEFAGTRLRLLKPATMMNLSGRSVGKALNYFKIPAERVLCVYDELDLPPGRAKLKFGGGHAGHNGMRSMIEHIGPDFWRIRLGVGHPGDKSRVVGHVLRPASRDEETLIRASVDDALEAATILISRDEQAAQNALHSHRPERPAKGD